MSEIISKQQNELAKIIQRYVRNDGVHATDIPSLFFIRDSNASVPRHGVYKPSFCIVVQGAKEVWLGKERFIYNPSDYLIASVNLPVTAQVTEASPNVPYLGFKLEFTANQILDVLRDSEIRVGPKDNAKRGMFVSRLEPELLDAVIRLARLLDTPKDIPILSPLFTKEILYRVLQGQHGVRLEQIAIEGSSAHQIKDVIEHITNNYNKSLRVEELAEKVNMSVSSLHRHFKEVTAMSPIQFQKELRLQEARRLLLTESADATDVAFRVGYESPSQFSREYSRMYGFPPKQDMKRLKA
ncbi:AraC family transcriptional regulator [Paenibacillus selenitireducens]|uniref:AraC family transcriptional regulator n=1 Tax=Paenibacillus selenitireducens TaxID=1324314 RepID=A0A1T2WZU6_9BACL|nr:AraC family transcriptional regulator [Paenibacillus selenitireducens]OPA72996.1 AraC family transcriptional regulator [Paenibacillus selenitireducens]